MLRCFFFFFNDTATTEIYTLSLHDALPIYRGEGLVERAVYERVLPHVSLPSPHFYGAVEDQDVCWLFIREVQGDRKSTRLNSSHSQISYAVFCLKKKMTTLPPVGSRTSHTC